MTINNLAAFDAAIRAACPYIDGVATDGYIFFQDKATTDNRKAANMAAQAYTDPPNAQVLDTSALATLLKTKGVITQQEFDSVHKVQDPQVSVLISPVS